MPGIEAIGGAGAFAEVILSPAEMAEADRITIASGTPGIALMERAGVAVAAAARALWRRGSIAVLAGPGNNGGDGWVAARLLRDAGFRVTVVLHGDRDRLRGDAAEAAARFRGAVVPAEQYFAVPAVPRRYIDPESEPAEWEAMMKRLGTRARPGLIIDALFGAGVRLPLSAEAARIVQAVNSLTASQKAGYSIYTPSNRPVVLSVDLPTGLDGATGAVSGGAIQADATVTFFRRKPGHLLLPGRNLCGKVTVADIGIGPGVLGKIGSRTCYNAPGLWLRTWPRLGAETHKYQRGHAVVVSGPGHATGAARLAALAALRVGAGAVTIASPPDALAANAAHLTAVMLRLFDGPEGLAALLDQRTRAVVIGPGAGVGESTAALVEAVLAKKTAAAVLDADALTSFAGDPARLFTAIGRSAAILAPHDGEFARLFPDITAASRLDRARAAAKRSGGVVISKGADTVVAAPDGRASIADNAPPTLATAGSGDVLAGLAGGLLAQGMPAFEAASAAVWLHGEAARVVGAGLIAEDLATALPAVLGRVFS